MLSTKRDRVASNTELPARITPMPLRNLAVAFVTVLFCSLANAQFLPAKQDSLDSKVLQQKRTIDVHLPEESAKEPAQRYETIYVLDGDWNAQLVVDIIGFMRHTGFIPPVIVVSVPNFFDDKGINSRDHDLTPTVVKDQPRSGGAAQFLSFLKTELIPYVNEHYPTNRTNLIHGHSFGGTFLFYVLMNDPNVFDGYMILDPAMWWDNHLLDAVIDAKLAQLPTKGKAIYIAARSGLAYEGMGMSTIEPIFKRKAPADLHWNVTAYPDETHDSLKLKGTYDALKFAYQGYTNGGVEIIPKHGIVIKGKPFLAHVENERFDVRYTTDGTVPNASSPKVGNSIEVSDPEKTKLRLLSNRGIFDREIGNELKSGVAIAPTKRTNDAASPNWHFALFASSSWPNFSRAKVIRSGETDDKLDLRDAGRDDFNGAAERDLVISEDGYYVLHIESTQKARVSMSGKELFATDGANGNRQEAFVVPLLRGTYRTRLDFEHPSKDSAIRFRVYRCKDGDAEWWKNELYRLSGDEPGR